MDGSRRLTVRNRRHLRKIQDPVDIEKPMKEAEKVVVEEEDDNTQQELLLIPDLPVPLPSPVQSPVPDLVPEPAPASVTPALAPAPAPEPPVQEIPRPSTREWNAPDMLAVGGVKKTYCDVVKMVRVKKAG